MRFAVWIRLLARYRFAVTRDRVPFAVLTTFAAAPLNSLFALVQRLVYGRRIAAEALPDPVIIVGHWRAGTTLLHELLATDGDFVFPTTFECFAPEHFLITWPITRLPFLLPERRPMDEMRMDWDRPQEDEFALMSLGERSPYEAIAFPGSPAERHRFYDLAVPKPEEAARWRATLTRFLKAVAFRGRRERRNGAAGPRWLLLKNPVHTARIGLLAEMFPGARFIHLVREPTAMFASTALTFQALTSAYGCQNPDRLRRDDDTDAAEETLARLDRLYQNFAADRDRLAPGRFVELRYEDLVRDPAAALGRIYAELCLKPFHRSEALRTYLRRMSGYRTNHHQIEPALAGKIAARWSWYARAFGYADAMPRAASTGDGG
jgi:hypothetical protein